MSAFFKKFDLRKENLKKNFKRKRNLHFYFFFLSETQKHTKRRQDVIKNSFKRSKGKVWMLKAFKIEHKGEFACRN